LGLLQEYELLRKIPVFADIEPGKLKLLAFMSERIAFDAGKALCRQGDQADAAYLILEGAAEIVGEMAILCDVPRTATVQAKDRLVVLRIAKDPFMRMVREFPNMAVSIMRELAHRLELTNNQLRGATSELRRLQAANGHPGAHAAE
jgi:CRP-like cAMP-binding protein